MPIPVIIIQPPLVQLNAPYPSGAYLAAFFRGLGREGWSPAGFGTPGADGTEPAAEGASRGGPANPAGPGSLAPVLGGLAEVPGSVKWIDGSDLLFRAIFSAGGLARLFGLSAASALALASKAERSGDAETAFQLRRYLSLSDSWVEWIDPITEILRGGDRELCHAFVRSPHAPRGARMDAWYEALETEPTADDARTLATLAVEDLADYATMAYDPEFSLVRYAESLAASEPSFARVEAGIDRPAIRDFLEPALEPLWEGLDGGALRGAGRALFCLSVPFPGCLVGALAIARSVKRRFGGRAVVAMGGGYVNTELRDCDNDRLFSYIDQLSFDRGYGGYAHWFRLGCPDTAARGGDFPRRVFCPPDLARFEREVTASIVPDYRDVELSEYPRLADTPNPMHRLWSDGAWLKAMLAHGCYWHRCSFCDVTLDYIRGFRPVDVAGLHAGLSAQAERHGVRGVHFVDEAAPPRALRDFALLNRASRRPLSFWGNIRFERAFGSDLAEFLSAGGLVAVSGGIEIASEEGFKSVDKGIDLENLVASCAAFKESGVLVHAYLIYGYWNEDAQGVIDAAETMRQLFTAGLVDSAFWHKFVLTRHSRVYDEWKRGMYRGGPSPLEPAARNGGDAEAVGDFANNDLSFRGEADSSKYAAPLDAALHAWMAGEGLSRSVRKWFPFPMPAPRVAPDAIGLCIAAYERRRDAERAAPFDPASGYAWTASRPVALSAPAANAAGGEAKSEYAWWHMGEETRRVLPDGVAEALAASGGGVLRAGGAQRAAKADAKGGEPSETAKPGEPVKGIPDPALNAALATLSKKDFAFLRRAGLCKTGPLG